MNDNTTTEPIWSTPELVWLSGQNVIEAGANYSPVEDVNSSPSGPV